MQAAEVVAASATGKVLSPLTIEKATASDFERVYPLLMEFNVPGLAREDWRRLFTKNWKSPEDFCGYSLSVGGQVQGFLGLLFSSRTINGKSEKFCNMTSWIVRDEYRSQSLRLLLEVLKLKDYTFTNFTPSPTVWRILEQLRFTKLNTSERILFPAINGSAGRSKYRCSFDLEIISDELSEADRIIFDDHKSLPCRHLLISSGNDYCYLVLKNRAYRRLPFARAHYVSNRQLFKEAAGSVRNQICWKLKVAGLIVDDRYLNGTSLSSSRSYPQQCPAFYKSSTIDDNDIDTLYSEMILLHS